MIQDVYCEGNEHMVYKVGKAKLQTRTNMEMRMTKRLDKVMIHFESSCGTSWMKFRNVGLDHYPLLNCLNPFPYFTFIIALMPVML